MWAVDVDSIARYDPQISGAVHARQGQGVLLDPDQFYILASKEHVAVPPHVAAEMVAYDTTVGEFRVHYDGFFDPGFAATRPAVRYARRVEVRSHEVPFLIDDARSWPPHLRAP
jgi:dCTP deaminase